MQDSDYWIFDEEPRTGKSSGCYPSERSLEQLLDCGFILVNKPPGPTSHQLAAWSRNLLGLGKIGHGGTLDPFATGLLTLLCGRATKVTGEILNKPKRYIAVLRFKEGKSVEEISELLDKLSTDVYNVPPKESAVKVQVRSRKIEKASLLDSSPDTKLHVVSINCDAGTYIRTLSKDIGLIIDSKCDLLELHRRGSGRFEESMACSMQQLTDAVFLWQEHGDERGLRKLISPIEGLLYDLPNLVIKDGAVAAMSHGAPLTRPGLVKAPRGIKRGTRVLVSSIKGEAVAIAELSLDSDQLESISVGEVATATRVLMPSGTYPQTW